MAAPLRSIAHPGPVARRRHSRAWAERTVLDVTIEPGESIEAGLGRGLAAAGCHSGYVEFHAGRLDPFRFVMPAGSPGESHAAWYSQTHAPEGGVTVERAGAIVGTRDGAPFVHCHGLWHSSDRERRMGHMLPPVCLAAEPIRAVGTGLSGAVFASREDAETNFRLFAAEAVEGCPPAANTALAVTLRPNQDVCHAIEAICRDVAIECATVHGIGSLNGARFEDGPPMASYASELLIRKGRLEGGKASLDVAVVAMDGTIFEGRLLRGDNPVCVTFELVIVPDGEPD